MAQPQKLALKSARFEKPKQQFLQTHKQVLIAVGTLLIMALVIVGTILGKWYEVSYPLLLTVSILIPYSLFIIIDRYFFPTFDTLEELKKNNIAVALYVLSYAAIAVAAILSAGGFFIGGGQ
jgi:hypothetical protein